MKDKIIKITRLAILLSIIFFLTSIVLFIFNSTAEKCIQLSYGEWCREVTNYYYMKFIFFGMIMITSFTLLYQEIDYIMKVYYDWFLKCEKEIELLDQQKKIKITFCS